MKFLTSFQLAALGVAELYALRRQAFEHLGALRKGSLPHRRCLNAMTAIERELRSRGPQP